MQYVLITHHYLVTSGGNMHCIALSSMIIDDSVSLFQQVSYLSARLLKFRFSSKLSLSIEGTPCHHAVHFVGWLTPFSTCYSWYVQALLVKGVSTYQIILDSKRVCVHAMLQGFVHLFRLAWWSSIVECMSVMRYAYETLKFECLLLF